MLVIKAMSDENLPDHDPKKGFSLGLFPTKSRIDFSQGEQGGAAELKVIHPDGDAELFYLNGNVYVMENGVTIATFHPM